MMKIYLVGGAVRDRLMGKVPSDLDYVIVDGSEEELRRAVHGLVRVGKGFAVYVRGHEQYTLSTCSSIEEDLSSRDLTVNVMAMDRQGRLITCPGAQEDLQAGILRPVARANFHADPLRALRAARFSAQWPDFSVHPELVETLREMTEEQLAVLAGERVGQEVMKACASLKPGHFVRLLSQGGCCRPWFRILAECVPEDVEAFGRHMDQAAGNALAVWIVLCADSFRILAGRNDQASDLKADDVLADARAMRLPSLWQTAGMHGVRQMEQALRYPSLPGVERVRLVTMLEKARTFDPFWLAARALGADFGKLAAEELHRIRAVRLPLEARDLGPRSAEILLRMQAEALES